MTGPQITVFIGADHDLVHTSLLITGFCALERQGAISLRLQRPPAADRWLVADPMVVCFDVRGGASARVAIDLRDGEGISRPIIDRVQWYLKRAYYPPELKGLPPETAQLILPFGLNYGCRGSASTVRTLIAVGPAIAARGRAGLARLRHYWTTPPPQSFEQSPDVPVEPLVTFQTRLWAAEEIAGDDAEEINAGRVAVVRALRRAFGNRFVGGLVPTAYARAHYPDDLTPHSSRYVEYLALRKRCLIGVYTRGVYHSLAFKLGETFAAAQCLVSHPLRYGLPAPLVHGTHYLVFETPDQCVDACRQLIDQPVLAAAMRRANHEYYRREVEPAAHVRRVLERLGIIANGT